MPLTHDIPYDSERHARIIDRIRQLTQWTEGSLSTMRERMRRDEQLFYGYIDSPLDEEQERKNQRSEDGRNRPAYSTLKIPYTYAIAMASHTYITSALLSRDPIFQLAGRNGESQNKEMCAEALLDYHVTAGRMRPQLYNWLLDPFRYGFGVLGIYWNEEYQNQAQLIEVPNVPLTGTLFGSRKQIIQTKVKIYEGNCAYCVRPLDFGWDPRYAIADFQRGEFCYEISLMSMGIIEQGVKQGYYIKKNVLKAKDMYETRFKREPGSDVREDPEWIRNFFAGDPDDRKHSIVVQDFYWDIIPKDWGLSASEELTRYCFKIADDSVILAAYPLHYRHGRFPFVVQPLEVDFYKKYTRSLMGIGEPFESAIDWLINQHFYNIRTHLNNNAIVDPSRINIKDLHNRQPGDPIRLRPEAYGTNPAEAYFQMPVTDVTRAHISDTRVMEEFAQRVMGVNDNVMGLVNPGGRKTAAEVRVSSSFATNRLKTYVEWVSALSFSELSRMMLSNAQQFMTEPMQLRIAGSLVGLGGPVIVKPEDIAGFYDFQPVDGSMPIDRQGVANILRDMMQSMVAIPGIQGAYDVLSFFDYIGKLMGVRNLDRFRIQTQVVPDAQAQDEMGSGAQKIAMNPSDMTPQPSQVPGMGQMM